MLAVTILGNNSALPAYDRHPTAQLVTLDDQLFLVDCGEGTQVQLSRYRIRWGRINYIFISHLHGDHYFGLPGFLNSMGLLHRENDLHLFAPPELEPILDLQFKAASTVLPYKLHFHPLTEEGVLVKTDKFKVTCFPTKHRIPCWGFRFEQVKAPRRVNPEKAVRHGVPAAFYDKLKWGENYTTQSGNLVMNEMVTDPAAKPKSYAYCADTIYDEELIPRIEGVDMLYHETTYLRELNDRAAARFHSTTEQAANIAKSANVGRLLIGHFSSKYENLDQFQAEAREVFPATDLAIEGVTFRG
ncbi:ribonuclease Z [Pseudobacter ginsenosidimutans]|uniref:Ribonuclease Z n=1 Tax=Pseudobacter ginsenosidimutans TaxID=661488 RepID=A0A4Q7MNN4_9BACT|nr:ribonuclease Z [Pseudobacter ginsenosidimutans]QEC40205.1 ribonuclease Z [Pseudobacter ginsenosidimutans]RZS69198.1 ribonuclease Z [Pseudobacter ginsenosidimutans]